MFATWPIWLGVTAAVGISYGLALLAIRVSPILGWMDRPDGQRKRHCRPTPLLGGVAIYLALVLSASCVRLLAPPWLSAASPVRCNTLMLFLSGGCFCLLGLIDDRWELGARRKFFWQIAASLPFAIWGRSIDSLEFMGWHVELGPWATLFTVFWLVAFANVINLIDGLDGLAGTIGMLVSLTIAVLAGISGHGAQAVLSLLTAATLAGFLGHNWPPARIFMGDSGSLTVGFLIGALSMESWVKQAAGFTLIVPLVLVSIPMFDTVMAIVRRKLTGQSVGRADRGHIHHRLQDRGLTPLQVLLALSGLCLVMALVAVASVVLDSDWLAVGLCLSVLALLVIGRVFGHDELRLLSQHLRYREDRPAGTAQPQVRMRVVSTEETGSPTVAARMGPLQPDAEPTQKAA